MREYCGHRQSWSVHKVCYMNNSVPWRISEDVCPYCLFATWLKLDHDWNHTFMHSQWQSLLFSERNSKDMKIVCKHEWGDDKFDKNIYFNLILTVFVISKLPWSMLEITQKTKTDGQWFYLFKLINAMKIKFIFTML